MNKKSILLAYASRFGSTKEVAEAIASTLRATGAEVDLQPAPDVKGLDGYDAVVLGAAIYNGQWHPDAHGFLSHHQEGLKWVPVAIFALGPLSTSAGAMRNSLRQLDKELLKYPWLKPVAVSMFAGKYDPSKPGLSFFERLMPASDQRDWDAIRSWAETLPIQLNRVLSR